MGKREYKLKRTIGTQRICAVWTNIADHMQWHEEWVNTCVQINNRPDNPNRELEKRGERQDG